MKVPPKRKGNVINVQLLIFIKISLNESPSEKEGKCDVSPRTSPRDASMKAPPKRKGNNRLTALEIKNAQSRLNESPSEKEGKYLQRRSSKPSYTVPQ